MSSNSSWLLDEDAQRCWIQGVIVSSITYGITVALYSLSCHPLVRGKNRMESKKRLLLLIYTTVAFVLGTLFMIALAVFTQMAFIGDHNYLGGPSAFENHMFSIHVNDACNAAFVLSNWLSDALVVWRFKVIYQECGVPIWIVMLLPCLVLAGSVALGIMFLIQASTANPYVTNTINFTLPYLGLSLALNIVLTISIVLRLLIIRHRIVSVLGPKYRTQYTSVVAMTIESAAIYSVVSITFLVLFGIGNEASQVFIQSISQIQVWLARNAHCLLLTPLLRTIATLLIVFRIAQGKGWSEETAARVLTTRGSESLELAPGQFTSAGASVTVANAGKMVKNISGDAA